MDFRQEFEAETEKLLRARFLVFSGLVGGLGLLLTASIVGVQALVASAAETSGPFAGEQWAIVPIAILWTAVYAGSFFYVWQSKPAGQRLLVLTTAVVIADGVLNVLARIFGIANFNGLPAFMLSHALACAFLPWTPWQALRPALVVLAFSTLSHLVFEPIRSTGTLAFHLAMSPLVVVPGIIICWLRQSRRMQEFKLRFLQRRYGEVRQELFDARRIHEALFPPPIETGPVCMDYRYEPMRQIGGDYLFAFHSPGPDAERPLSIVVMDVTGHGIPAALTVNRLHGELQRIFAEDPCCTPGSVLRLLNRYVHLTLATHSVYVTALCFRADPAAHTMVYASGGHPPAFLRAIDGTIHELASTAFVLGACADVDFEPGQVSLRFGPGDSLIAYTDGAIEARDSAGRMLGVKGMQRLVVSDNAVHRRSWVETILRAVESHRAGPPADDTLVIEIARPLSPLGPSTAARAPAAAARAASSRA